MIIGVPREIKIQEYRVALTPAGVDALIHAGHQVVVEDRAGRGVGFSMRIIRRRGPRSGARRRRFGPKPI